MSWGQVRVDGTRPDPGPRPFVSGSVTSREVLVRHSHSVSTGCVSGESTGRSEIHPPAPGHPPVSPLD